jgi:Flp pilus assembly protein TadG
MRSGRSQRRILSLTAWRRWSRETKGGVAVYVALSAAVTLGIVGLAIDGSRALILRSESQAAADAAALAGASQLDGTPSAMARANTAIANLVANSQRLASTGAGSVGVANVRFLSGLPASDASPITGAFVTFNPLEARFVEVTTAPLTHTNTFLRAVGVADSTTVTTAAIGGGRQMVCQTQPMMICNPSESAGNVGAPFDIGAWRGRQIRLLYQHSQGSGGGAQWAPGNFGYLSPAGNGANALADALASVNGANICYGTSVETEPGLTNGARTALNVRFGLYQNPQFGGNARNDPQFAPDINVRAMPRDAVFAGADLRFGNGHWDCQAYWNANFSGSGIAKPAACQTDTSGYTRYDMHRYEVANNLINAPGPGGATGVPPQNAANALADRRIIYVAVINCIEQGVNGRAQDVPTLTFLRVFLTEPVPTPSAPNGVEIFGEILGVVEIGADDTVLREIVQLYR